jgi:hypothetical protein
MSGIELATMVVAAIETETTNTISHLLYKTTGNSVAEVVLDDTREPLN